jgi:hypothetical protein
VNDFIREVVRGTCFTTTVFFAGVVGQGSQSRRLFSKTTHPFFIIVQGSQDPGRYRVLFFLRETQLAGARFRASLSWFEGNSAGSNRLPHIPRQFAQSWDRRPDRIIHITSTHSPMRKEHRE